MSNKELIEEARIMARFAGGNSYNGDLLNRLTDALEAVTEERDDAISALKASVGEL